MAIPGRLRPDHAPAAATLRVLLAGVRRHAKAAYNFVQRRERTLHPVFDIDMFVKVLGWRVYEAMQFHTSQNLVD